MPAVLPRSIRASLFTVDSVEQQCKLKTAAETRNGRMKSKREKQTDILRFECITFKSRSVYSTLSTARMKDNFRLTPVSQTAQIT